MTNAIIALLWAHQIPAWRTGVGAFPAEYGGKRRFVRMGTRGMSDIVACMPTKLLHRIRIFNDDGTPNRSRVPEPITCGRFLAIEVKSPTGKVRPEQTAFLQEVVRAGGIGFVARSVEEVVEKLGLGR